VRRLLFAFLVLTLPFVSFAEEKKPAPKKKPVAAKKQKQDDWGRFNSTSKKDLDAADRKKAEKAAKK
jgi:hypothetical protein